MSLTPILVALTEEQIRTLCAALRLAVKIAESPAYASKVNAELSEVERIRGIDRAKDLEEMLRARLQR